MKTYENYKGKNKNELIEFYNVSDEIKYLYKKMINLSNRIAKHKRKKARFLKAYKRLEEKTYNIII